MVREEREKENENQNDSASLFYFPDGCNGQG